MGVLQRIYGLAVFAATCLLVKSNSKLDHHGGQGEISHLYHLSLRRSLLADAPAASSDDTRIADSPAVMWGSLILTAIITTALVLALALCTCGKKPKSRSSSPEPELKPEENPDEVTPVGNGPSSPVVMTVDSPQTPKSPSPEMHTREAFQPVGSPNGGVMNSPPSPNFDISDIPYADAPSISPVNGPTRGATINRRLPQLPQSPPPAVPDGDEKEPDYDQTYDVIPEKRKDITPTDDLYDKGGGYERLRDTKANGPIMPTLDAGEGPYAKVNEGRQKKKRVEETADPNYNSIEETRGATGGAMSPPGDLDSDGHYASVGGDGGEIKDDPYARVKERSREGIDRSNGYARVRDVQNTPTSPPVELSGGASVTRVSPIPDHRGMEKVDDEDDVPPAIPEKIPDLDNGMDMPGSPSNQSQRLPSIGSSSGLSAHVDRTSPVPPASPQLNNSQGGLAASIAAGTAAVAHDGQDPGATQTSPQPTNVHVKEKPYTQVSARESLEFVRARQQAQHTARTAAHYEFVNENENDYDGIYETVNEGQMSPQPERPPPLPNNRQSQAPGPAATWQLQAPIARPALYEEINENDRPQAPAAVAVAEDDNDEMQPYAVTQNPTAANRPANLTAQRSAPNSATGAMYAQVDKDRGGSAKTSELYSQVKRPAGGSVRSGNQDPRSKVEGLQSPPGVAVGATLSPNQQGDNFDGLYAKVQKTTSLDGSQKKRPKSVEGHIIIQSPDGSGPDSSYQSIDEVMNEDDTGNGAGVAGMVHISQHAGSQHKWKRKEHTYQAVDAKNAKKGKKDKKDKKEKKDHQNNRTPSPQPQANPWQPRFPPQHSAYEEVNVNNSPALQGSTNDNANKKSRSRTNSREQVKINGLANQDLRVRTNSREQIRVNGTGTGTTTQLQQQQESRSRTNSREQGGMNGSVSSQDTRVITGPQENGNNNCNQSEYFWPGYVQETRL